VRGVTLLVAMLAGVAIGLGLGALGGGGSILAVPVLLALGQSPAQATTGSLVVVGTTALTGAVAAHRSGQVLVARGLAFGLVATGGAVAGARLSVRVAEAVLLGSFSLLLIVVAALMVVRRIRSGRAGSQAVRSAVDEPILTFNPTFACRCPRAARVLATATVTGLLVGFLGVGGGFVVVPALVLALGLDVRRAAGTALVVIAVTSAVALAVRAGSGARPDWVLTLGLTGASVIGGSLGIRLAARTSLDHLATAFTGLVVTAALATATHAIPTALS
jgi:uncharacterized membrane protein YfcA